MPVCSALLMIGLFLNVNWSWVRPDTVDDSKVNRIPGQDVRGGTYAYNRFVIPEDNWYARNALSELSTWQGVTAQVVHIVSHIEVGDS